MDDSNDSDFQTSETLRRTLNRKFRQTKKAINNIDNKQHTKDHHVNHSDKKFSSTSKEKFNTHRTSKGNGMFPSLNGE